MRIALVAHDNRKRELIEWVKYNLNELKNHELYATGTTGKMLLDIEGDANWEEIGGGSEGATNEKCCEYPLRQKVNCLHSGPLGGDAEIGSMIANDKLDILIFFCDNLAVQGHQNDIYGLTRLASLYNIAFATNRTTADMILTSPLFKDPNYKKILPNAIEKYKNRIV